jgi:antitoxin HicB
MKKNLKYYLGLKYPVTTEKDEDGYSLEIPDLPGCHAYGKTLEEAWKRLEAAKKAWLEVSIEKKFDIEEPNQDQFSGKLLLRIPPRLHAKMAKEAKKKGVSLNRHLQVLLEEGSTSNTLQETINEMRGEIKLIKERVEKLPPTFIHGVTATTIPSKKITATITTAISDSEYATAEAKSDEGVGGFYLNSGPTIQ